MGIVTLARIVLLSALGLLFACSSGTATREQKVEEIVYPASPEAPRYYYEYSLTSSAQVTTNQEEARMRRILTGETTSGQGMSKPFDVAVCQGVLYVSDTVRRIVHVFDFARGGYREIGDQEPGTLEKPLGLTTDAQCNLYVVDGTQARIVVYNQDGGYLTAVGGASWFERLSHVAVDPEGRKIYAVDTGGIATDKHRIRVFDVASGRHLYDIGTRGSGALEFNLPRDIAYHEGKLYVVDGGNFRVQVLTEAGKHLLSFGEVGDRWGQFSRPKGIGVDADGNIYVSDTGFGNFQIFNPEGRLLLNIGERSNKPKPGGYMLPSGIDLDEDDRIYFVGQFFRKVDIFRPAKIARGDGYLGPYLIAR